MRVRWLAVALVALLVVPGPAMASVRGEPDITVGLADDTVRAGEETTLAVTVANGADLQQASLSNPALNQQVTTARAVAVSLERGGPVRVETGTQLVGSLADGQSIVLPFDVSVRDDAKPGTYDVPVEIEYTYTPQISELVGAADRKTVTVTRTVEVRVEESARFRVVGTDADLRAGESGRVEVTLENAGTLTARDAQFTLRSADPSLSPGETGVATRFVDRWAPGETRTLTYSVRAASDVRPQPYTLELAPTYRDSKGETVQASSLLVGATPRTDSRFAVVDGESSAVAGGSGTVTMTLRNDGSTPITDAVVSLSAAGGLAVDGSQSASRYVGTWAPGETRTLTYDVETGPETVGGTYTLDATVTFDDADGTTVRSHPIPVGVEVAPRFSFAVESVETDAVAEGTGTVTMTLRNAGERTVSDARVALESSTASLAVDGGPSASRYLGTWAPGETRTVTYDLTAGPETTAGTYTLSARVSYDNGGETVTSRPAAVGVPLAGTLEFGVESLQSDLHVGERGTIRGTVVNEGDRTARNAVVVLGSRSPHVAFPEAAVSVGDLGPGDSAEFAVDTDVAPTGIAGERPFSLTVEYEASDGTTRASDSVSFRRSVGPDRELLRVEPVNATFAPDTSNRLVVRVTNTGDAPREEISLRITPLPPFTSVAPEAYVPRLAPGESAEVAFEITVDEDAVESTHAVPLNATSEPEGSDTAALDTYQVPVTVAEETSGPFDLQTAIAAVILAVAIAAGAAYWWYRQR